MDTYSVTIHAVGAMALLMLVQLLVADFAGLRAKHPPGSPVEADHKKLLFRASRAVANTNESIGIFIVLVLYCLWSRADPAYTGYAAWAYVLARVCYALCYWGDVRRLRSVCFGVSVLALLALLAVGAGT